MRIVIAPDKFKGCLSARQVADSIAAGVREVYPAAEIDLCPMADGGEGTVDALLQATSGRRITTRVSGPLPDQQVDADWGFLGGESTAVIEMSAASGFALVPAAERNPMNTTTFGTGELLMEAARQGATRVILGIGGSATVDAGLGCCQAVGHTVLRLDGEPTSLHEPLFGRDLESIYMIKRGRGSPLDRLPITVACDVNNPLFGPDGAAEIFGPQKGATLAQVRWFGTQHHALATRCHKLPEAETPGAGAAGGLGWALLSFFDATLTPGIELMIETCHLRQRLVEADLCLTGEGSFDAQSLAGKTAAGVGRVCQEVGVACGLLAGRIDADPESLFAQAKEVSPRAMPLHEAFKKSAELIQAATVRLLTAGHRTR